MRKKREHPFIFVVAAEPSGDLLGAELMEALKTETDGRIDFVGLGGPAMAEQGIESPFDIKELSVLGLWEGLRIYPRVLRRAREIAELAHTLQPDLAVLIDSWGFTLRVARNLRRLSPDLPLIKYVGPQVWASRPGRARTLAQSVDMLMTIHSFDAPYFEKEGLPTYFVGHPVLARRVDHGDREKFLKRHRLRPEHPVLTLLFGSRSGEVTRLVDPFAEALALLRSEGHKFESIALLSDAVREDVRALAHNDPRLDSLIFVGEKEKYDAFAASTAALACSGTVTTELAMAGVPGIVAYRLSPLTAFIARRLIRTPYISLVNIAANEDVFPEYLQEVCTGEHLASALKPLLFDPKERKKRQGKLARAIRTMRGGKDHASLSAAKTVLDYLNKTGQV